MKMGSGLLLTHLCYVFRDNFMSRPLRIEYPNAWYHVMNRGRRGEEIFHDKHDYHMFINLLVETTEMLTKRSKNVLSSFVT